MFDGGSGRLPFGRRYSPLLYENISRKGHRVAPVCFVMLLEIKGSDLLENCGIYRFYNTINGKSYIGKSNNLTHRISEHLRRLRHGNDGCVILNRAWQKYGEENFAYEIVCYCDEDELNEKEVEYIAKYNSFEDGYNCTKGGDGITGFHHTDDTKEIIRQTSTGRLHTEESKKKMSEYWKGRVFSEEHKAKMSAAWTPERKEIFIKSRSGENNPNYGRTGINWPTSKAITCINTGDVFPSGREAAKWAGCRPPAISRCRGGYQPYAGNHPITGEKLSWRDATDDEIYELMKQKDEVA